MVMQVSKIFSTDVEEIMKTLKIMSAIAFELDNMITNEFYTKREILQELKNMTFFANRLKSIFTSILIKAQKYKPRDIVFLNYLNNINEYIKKLNLIAQMSEVAYERDPDYNVKGVFRDLKTIIRYINLIKSELEKGIQKGLFM